ncbi:glycoside hydrolase family protein [Salix suchowensis]|nr:glycoside hydrolase family protein [Salix suchowensis]
MFRTTALLAFSFLAVSYGQQVGTLTAETHPTLSIQQCTRAGSCQTQSRAVVLDSNWRWLHTTSGSTNCYTGNEWDASLCPDPATCASNCAPDGADYSGTYDVQLKNQEFTFDIDMSQLPCGLNGALYFSQMEADGGMSKFSTNAANVAGWEPSPNDQNAGKGQYGSCCAEMDVWEANSMAAAYTPHPCTVKEATRCEGNDCGDGDNRYGGVCDKDGCDFNSFRMGDRPSWVPFVTADNSTSGTLTEIRRLYVQNGQVIQNSKVNIPGMDASLDSITEDFCTSQKTVFGDTNSFQDKGGLAAMGDAFQAGMVLVMSIWDDHEAKMLWLDSNYPLDKDASEPGVARGTCATTSGEPTDVESQSPNAQVTFSNIKFGPIGSTF